MFISLFYFGMEFSWDGVDDCNKHSIGGTTELEFILVGNFFLLGTNFGPGHVFW